MPAKGLKAINKYINEAEPIEVSPSVGLTADQVKQRRKEGLVNKTKKHVTKSYWRIFTDNFFNFLNMLMVAVLVFMIIAGLSWSHYLFLFILTANIIVGIVQDVHARHLVSNLRVITDPKANVLREGKVEEVPMDGVVLSDIMILGPGDQIGADCKIVEGEVSVDESLLSGESRSIKKTVGDQLLSGTFLTKGTCKAEVIRVGSANYAETLQKKASQFTRPKSEIKSSISRLMIVCCVIAILLGLFTFLAWLIPQLVGGKKAGEIFVYGDPDLNRFIEGATGSMVAMLPTGMFLLTSLALTSGVVRLAKKNMLVQQLYCIEALARVDVLCLDKTGTLTDGLLTVTEFVPFGEYTEESLREAAKNVLAFTHDGNPTAIALRAACGSESNETPREVLPFDSGVKYAAATLEGKGTFALGAYGFIPGAQDENMRLKMEEYMRKGYRCLIVAHSDGEINQSTAPTDFALMGFVVLFDHIRDDAYKNIAWFRDNGVSVRVISGDDAITVSEIAKRAGVEGAERYVSLEGIPTEEVAKFASEFVVFGRATPEQKAVLIETYKTAGHKVAMTGDGINDILALKVADCSIAMASGSDAARNVSHLVSLESNFSKLPKVVEEGRRVINNLQRSCSLFLNKTLFAVIVTFVFIISSLYGGRSYPFSTSNLLVWEIFAIGSPAFFLALQTSSGRLRGSFLQNVLINAIPAGIAECVAAFTPLIIALIAPESLTWSEDIFTGSFEAAKTLSVCCFTMVSFGVLVKVSLPLDKYRISVVLAFVTMGLTVMFGDFFARGKILALNWEGLKPMFIVYWIILVVVCIALYWLIAWFGERTSKALSNGAEEE